MSYAVILTCPVRDLLFLAWSFLSWICTSYSGDQQRLCSHLKLWTLKDVKMIPNPMTSRNEDTDAKVLWRSRMGVMITIQGKSRITWQSPEAGKGQEVSPAWVSEQISHCYMLVSDLAPRLCENVLLLAQATQFGVFCFDCPTNAAASTLILTKFLGPIFTYLAA